MKKKTRRRRYNAHLPEFVSPLTDRHGKVRLRYRRLGHKSGYFKSELGTEEFNAEYRAFQSGGPVRIDHNRAAPGTIDDLVAKYVAVPERLGPTEMTQRKIRNILDKFREGYGRAFVTDFNDNNISVIISNRAKMIREPGKRPDGGPEAAKKLRKELVRLFDFAISQKMITENPVERAIRVKSKPGTFHTWSEQEITKFRACHQLGTMPRLAMELMLWTGQRRGDAYTFGPQDIFNGRIAVIQNKTQKSLMLPVAPQLVEAITAMPPLNDDGPFLRNTRGKPFASGSFGNWFRDQCNAAGLPNCRAHGLRKATMRRMAELDMGNQSMKSVSGHSKDDEVALYTAAANQSRMADNAIAKLAEWERLTLASNRVSDRLKPAQNGEIL